MGNAWNAMTGHGWGPYNPQQVSAGQSPTTIAGPIPTLFGEEASLGIVADRRKQYTQLIKNGMLGTIKTMGQAVGLPEQSRNPEGPPPIGEPLADYRSRLTKPTTGVNPETNPLTVGTKLPFEEVYNKYFNTSRYPGMNKIGNSNFAKAQMKKAYEKGGVM
jgi:hypothetical protein